MQIKSLELILEEANKQIKRLSYDDSIDLIKNHSTLIIDVREESEVHSSGVIKNAIHIPRGLIEFKISNISTITEEDTNILVYCAGGYRSALAAKTLKDFGFKNVFNIGGYEEWILNGGEIQAFV
tara:strand:+ start:4051 stop:4425 length:375 start_codon:yes stop_codon:yes gene_type:complete